MRWRGYGHETGEPDCLATTWSNAEEWYISFRFTAADLQTGMQVPEFAWDDDGRLAWGGFLYPDSLAVAVEPERLGALYGSGLLTATGARPDDTMPPQLWRLASSAQRVSMITFAKQHSVLHDQNRYLGKHAVSIGVAGISTVQNRMSEG